MIKNNILFSTERLKVRPLELTDLEQFHQMQSDPKVMQFVRLHPMTFEENKKDLEQLIKGYEDKDNDFNIYAICFKNEDRLIGSIALVKDDQNDDEIGYRFVRKYWGRGFGFEVASGLITYCRSIEMKKLIAIVAIDNMSSIKIVEKLEFEFQNEFVGDLGIVERKYELIL